MNILYIEDDRYISAAGCAEIRRRYIIINRLVSYLYEIN